MSCSRVFAGVSCLHNVLFHVRCDGRTEFVYHGRELGSHSHHRVKFPMSPFLLILSNGARQDVSGRAYYYGNWQTQQPSRGRGRGERTTNPFSTFLSTHPWTLSLRRDNTGEQQCSKHAKRQASCDAD